MSILFKQKRRPNPLDRSAEQKFYLEYKIRGRITLEELLDKASENTTMDRDEIRLSLRHSFRMVGDYLA